MRALHLLYLKDTTIFPDFIFNFSRRYLPVLAAIFLFFLMQSCSSIQTGDRERGLSADQKNTPVNLFNVSAQLITVDEIKSVQLYSNNNPESPPILELNSNDKLQLHFDHLGFSSKQFIVTFSHHNKDWSVSSLAPGNITDGLRRIYLDTGKVSSSSRPLYRSYSATFPNEQISFLKSGNYMIRVEDADTGFLVMALPFFIFENEGSIESSVDFIQSPRQNLRSVHRPVSRYNIPDFVEQPMFNLSFRIAQNRFWARAKTPEETDFSSPESVTFEIEQDNAFTADYFFYSLSFQNISLDNPRVIDFFPEEVPPRVLLRDDAANMANFPNGQIPSSAFGLPENDIDSEYMNIVFSLETENEPEAPLYLVGDFTGWAIKSENRLAYDAETDRWKTSALIKEGDYKYKYVLMDNDKIDDLFYDPLFERTKQEYQVFVYLQDKNEFYDRLLQVNTVTAGS